MRPEIPMQLAQIPFSIPHGDFIINTNGCICMLCTKSDYIHRYHKEYAFINTNNDIKEISVKKNSIQIWFKLFIQMAARVFVI